MSEPPHTRQVDASRRRVQAVVALKLLEVLRSQDVPPEVLESEDTTVTLPRRLGLSDVVDRQIRTYREDVRRGHRLTDGEVRDLFRLVIRRPDADEVFLELGRRLAGGVAAPGWRRMFPRKVRLAMARGQVRRLLRRLFGRRIGGFGRGSFSVEGRSLLFIEADPGGEACFLVSGLCEAVLSQVVGPDPQVRHSLCQGRGDALCRWEGALSEAPVGSGDPPTAEVATL